MDDAHRATLEKILNDPSLTVPLKIQEFIRLYNENAGTGSPLAWNVSKEEWQRFEFLGDRVLNLVAAEFLYLHDPSCREGVMTKKMGVVSNESLAAIAEHRGIGIPLIVPVAIGQQQAYGDAVKGGAIEACVGAMYLCAGFESARVFVRELLSGEIERYNPLTNYIGRLQERYQQQGLPLP
ncbi:MAG: ribonuclease III domain-containing protein, partial [Methanoregula sp.]